MMPHCVHWIVMFGETDPPRLSWRRWLAHGYRHCSMVGDLPLGGSLLIEHVGSDLRLTQCTRNAEQMALAYLEAGEVRHAYLMRPCRPPPRPRLRPPMTCVEVVKAILGIHAPFVLTPLQLARHLVARGARDVAVRIPTLSIP